MYSHERRASHRSRQTRTTGRTANRATTPSPTTTGTRRRAAGHDVRPELLVGHLAELLALSHALLTTTRGALRGQDERLPRPALTDQVGDLVAALHDLSAEIQRLCEHYGLPSPRERQASQAVGNGGFLLEWLAAEHLRGQQIARRALLTAAALGEAHTSVVLGLRALAHERAERQARAAVPADHAGDQGVHQA
ncbi:hypothetical protein LX15_006295 [Streptoalloteichus tenebrarius]|uniref:Uncharacterized protein n=1 Tax=Streptoalloteichus tenebrarius (strain ATCC 17920 / DSM 40477 / JCM 4838 / CBS 697.72 / NBRC 16177 / NCIMB 11028 / NRRL B-12390 / A12253. 1 / ISP 5477) TaxID=1933 RepID=A0ABT1I487_STRSD|nr:hypothetical protein [Streptoalloteichus tenebrarius]MCP2262555.1 hypothetical protein [Streptoalloteichus tenebrarius]BFF00744.1 hypothetical protein GCM10020241_24190 [Streptoalloteichus tenebrarius]